CAASISRRRWNEAEGPQLKRRPYMAKEGSVAPKERINVTFKPATGNAQQEIELPLKLMVLGDFTQRVDERKIEDRKPISIDRNSFDEVLGKQSLSLTVAVPNRLQEDSEDDLGVALRINSMSDFNPASLVEQVPELKKLMDLREIGRASCRERV